MKPKALKSFYIIPIFLLFFITTVHLIKDFGDLGISLYTCLIFFISYHIGSFLYVFISGISIYEMQFYESDTVMQEFEMSIYHGSSKFIINGEFDNSVGLKENNLRYLIYRQTTRYMLKKLITLGTECVLTYDYHGKEIMVKFFYCRKSYR